MSDDNPLLFWKINGLDARTQHVKAIAQSVDTLSDDKVLENDPESLISDAITRGSVKVPVMDRGNISFERSQRTFRGQDSWGEQRERKQAILVFDVPFSGDGDIFKIRPSRWDSNPPQGKVTGSTLRITIPDSEDPAHIKREIDAILDSIDQYLGWHRELWAGVDEEMTREVRQRLTARSQRLGKQRESDTGLEGLGFKPKR